MQWLYYFSQRPWVGRPSGAGRVALAGRCHVVGAPWGPGEVIRRLLQSHVCAWAGSLEPWGLELRGLQGLLSPWDLSTQSLQHRASEEPTPVKAS